MSIAQYLFVLSTLNMINSDLCLPTQCSFISYISETAYVRTHVRTHVRTQKKKRKKKRKKKSKKKSTYVRNNTYVRKNRKFTPYGGYSPRTHAYARMTSLPVLSRHFRAHMGGIVLLGSLTTSYIYFKYTILMQFIQANKRSEGLKMFWTRKKKTRPTEDANDVRNALADSQLKWSN